jgi:hypothetical protein
MMAANHFSNNSGNRSINHQFGRNNPNSKRNLALMGVYQTNMQQQQLTQQQQAQAQAQAQARAPQFTQLMNAINCAYSNGCFGQYQYSSQIYSILMTILNRLPSDAVYMLQDVAYSLYRSDYQFLFSNAGALWANVPPAQQNAIINGINCGSQYQCITPNIYNMLQNLLSILNSYSGGTQTLSGVLLSDYSACVEHSPNQSVCNYFLEANNAAINNSNYQYLLNQYFSEYN